MVEKNTSFNCDDPHRKYSGKSFTVWRSAPSNDSYDEPNPSVHHSRASTQEHGKQTDLREFPRKVTINEVAYITVIDDGMSRDETSRLLGRAASVQKPIKSTDLSDALGKATITDVREVGTSRVGSSTSLVVPASSRASVKEDDKVKDLLDALEDDLNCPVCLSQLTPPVVQCSNGHSLCCKCRTGCRQCPLCRAHFLATSNRTLDNILRRLPKPCIYAFAGCHSKVSDNHQEEFCLFRLIECPLGYDMQCSWYGTVNDWLNHALRHGESLELKNGSTSPFVFYSVELPWSSACYKIMVKGNSTDHFLLIARKTSKTFSIAVKQVLTRKLIQEYHFQICLTDSYDQVMNKATLTPSVFRDNQDTNDNSMRMDVLLSDVEIVLNNANKTLKGYLLVKEALPTSRSIQY